jgi:hypothetical protein
MPCSTQVNRRVAAIRQETASLPLLPRCFFELHFFQGIYTVIAGRWGRPRGCRIARSGFFRLSAMLRACCLTAVSVLLGRCLQRDANTLPRLKRAARSRASRLRIGALAETRGTKQPANGAQRRMKRRDNCAVATARKAPFRSAVIRARALRSSCPRSSAILLKILLQDT